MADEYLTAYERIINLGPTLGVKAALPMALTRPIVVPTSASKRAEDLTDLETTPVDLPQAPTPEALAGLDLAA
jgi:hypothetical protein